MEIKTVSSKIYELSNKFGGQTLRFTVENINGKEIYIMEYDGIELHFYSEYELYDFVEMIKAVYKLTVQKNEEFL